MRKLYFVGALVLTVLLTLNCQAGGIATLGGRGDHDGEFRGALKQLGQEADHFKCNAAGMKALTESLDQYDIVLGCPLFNYGGLLKKGETDFAAWRNWLKSGGVLVFTEGNYIFVRNWLKELDEKLGGLDTAKCTSSQWAVMGHCTNEEPLDPLRIFPNLLKEGDSWPHVKTIEKGYDWKVLARCSEGCPTVISQEYGKGLVVISTLRQGSRNAVQNYLVNAQMRRLGLKVVEADVPALALGAGKLRFRFGGSVPSNAQLVYSIGAVQAKGAPKEFAVPLQEETVVDYKITDRGEVSAKLLYRDGTRKSVLLFERKAVLPKFIEVETADYRGILSTRRRTETVPFRINLTPMGEDLSTRTIKLRLFDSCSNCVANWSMSFPRGTPRVDATNFVVNLAMPQELTAGGYAINASYWQTWRYISGDSKPLEILAPNPAQVVIDTDRTFLVNGTPFFPLGIYHTCGDYEKIADIGFNTIQFWKWELQPDAYGRPRGFYHAVSKGLNLLFESNHQGEKVFKHCVDTLGDKPGILMWYVADEPGDNAELMLSERQGWWHKHDKQHPTFLASCRSDLFDVHQRFADVFAFDPYGSKATPFDAVAKTVSWFKRAQKATDGRKPLVCVPHAFPTAPGVLRAVAYVSLVHDARGIIWYCWKQTGGGPVGVGLHAHPDRQEEHRQILSEIKVLCKAGGLLSPYRRCFETGDIHGMVCGTNAKKTERFILLVNTSDKPAKATLNVPELKGRKELVKPFEDGQAVAIPGDNTVEVELEPYATRVYKF